MNPILNVWCVRIFTSVYAIHIHIFVSNTLTIIAHMLLLLPFSYVQTLLLLSFVYTCERERHIHACSTSNHTVALLISCFGCMSVFYMTNAKLYSVLSRRMFGIVVHCCCVLNSLCCGSRFLFRRFFLCDSASFLLLLRRIFFSTKQQNSYWIEPFFAFALITLWCDSCRQINLMRKRAGFNLISVVRESHLH